MGDSSRTFGDVVRAKLAELGWTQDDLARVMGRLRPEINLLIAGKRGLSIDVACDLAAALGGTPKEWMDLAIQQQLSLVPDTRPDVARMARLYGLAPIKEMERRGWIRTAENADELDQELRRFFGSSLESEPSFTGAFLKSHPGEPMSLEERAWCFRARHVALSVASRPFDPSRGDALAKTLRHLAAYPSEAYKLPTVLGDHGIRLVIVEPLKHTELDGVTFWLDDHSPVIGITLRHDRIDGFWFTVLHEYSHVRHGDRFSFDRNLVGKEQVPSGMKEEAERRADEEAAALLIPPDEMQSFVNRIGPLYSKERIVQFAHTVKIHPGIIVGQLQHRGEVPYSANREMLVKIRERAIAASVCDGWGRTVGTL